MKALEIVENSLFLPELILLDVMMPRMSGYEVCQKIREKHPIAELPIIMLTAKNQLSNLLEGLSNGANDYISKPFEIDELLARIRTRLKQQGTPLLEIGDLTVNTSTYDVERGGKSISLTAKEFKLLEYLIINKGAVLSREAILDHIWLYSPEIESRVVDVYIGYLRKKIDTGHDKKLIKSVRGFGYTIRE
jgi:DNA-binding response OmpR family regulator